MTKVLIISCLILVSSVVYGDSASSDEKEFIKNMALAEKGDAEAQYRVGVMLHLGKGVSENKQKGSAWINKSASQGNAIAQSYMALGFYTNGKYSEAFAWFKKSAEKGDAFAQLCLGDMYFEGKGKTQNYSAAFKWYRRSADQGITRAQYRLGLMYYDGLRVPQSYRNAIEWYRKAADQGNGSAQYNIGLMYYHGFGVS